MHQQLVAHVFIVVALSALIETRKNTTSLSTGAVENKLPGFALASKREPIARIAMRAR